MRWGGKNDTRWQISINTLPGARFTRSSDCPATDDGLRCTIYYIIIMVGAAAGARAPRMNSPMRRAAATEHWRVHFAVKHLAMVTSLWPILYMVHACVCVYVIRYRRVFAIYFSTIHSAGVVVAGVVVDGVHLRVKFTRPHRSKLIV